MKTDNLRRSQAVSFMISKLVEIPAKTVKSLYGHIGLEIYFKVQCSQLAMFNSADMVPLITSTDRNAPLVLKTV